MGLHTTQLCFLHTISKGSQKSIHKIGTNFPITHTAENKPSHLSSAAAQYCHLPSDRSADYREASDHHVTLGPFSSFHTFSHQPEILGAQKCFIPQKCAEKGKDETSGSRTPLLSNKWIGERQPVDPSRENVPFGNCRG